MDKKQYTELKENFTLLIICFLFSLAIFLYPFITGKNISHVEFGDGDFRIVGGFGLISFGWFLWITWGEIKKGKKLK